MIVCPKCKNRISFKMPSDKNGSCWYCSVCKIYIPAKSIVLSDFQRQVVEDEVDMTLNMFNVEEKEK